ncbi:hypothetical protein K470DRAFT_159232 [Piedraia hortae CBS 480.64]|uniref:Uncharacterized protein n=1 Tax=Piedraia hortae CBS 480.64 TaxID=1314780 RepID=A0A6A7BP13_9PEZI|nr:hypothetical protein K470DRAFT_273582 [Piedraia hortae CBS 480.64]KAF2857782.1 hypothetical protein K470DRAFT_159232 [Piedraia hortae CBS 480.64]
MATQPTTSTFGASIEKSAMTSSVLTPAGSAEKLAPFETDMESGAATPLSINDENPFTNKVSVDIKECRMWPSRQTLVQQRQEEKRRRRADKGLLSCAPIKDRWSNLSKRQRLAIRIVMAVLVVGILIAVGVGISAAVNGTYWKNGKQQEVVSSD